MENKNMTVAREWENDPNCFLRMLNSPAQQRSRAARRQKLAGLIEEEKRAAEVERQINAMLAELQTRSDALKKTIADTGYTLVSVTEGTAAEKKGGFLGLFKK